MSLFKSLRVFVLLVILAIVAGDYWIGHARLIDWDRPIWVTVYPMSADGQAPTSNYIASLTAEHFREIDVFLRRQSARHGLDIDRPVVFQLAPSPASRMPAVPIGDSGLKIAAWSLRMRWWAWRQLGQGGLLDPDIQVFIHYRSAQGVLQLDRSVGVRKGRFAVVNAYASRAQAARNRVVIAHELLHVLGATDKYVPGTGQPQVPDGLADPKQQPLYPQAGAELMAGAVALSPGRARMPASLREVVIGPMTAREIGWRR